MLAQGQDIVPIPGARRVRYLEENVKAVNVRRTQEDLARLDAVLPPGAAAGQRYSEAAIEDGRAPGYGCW